MNILPISVRAKSPLEKPLQSGASTDRDANGQQFGSGQQDTPPGPMTEEQIQQALEHLRNLPVVKEQNFRVELKVIETRKFVLITDSLGKVIRRIPEAELWSLNTTKDSSKAQLLSKVA